MTFYGADRTQNPVAHKFQNDVSQRKLAEVQRYNLGSYVNWCGV